MNCDIKNFLLEETKNLRNEIESLTNRIESTHRYALVSTGVFWSWLCTKTIKDLPHLYYLSVLFFIIMNIYFYLRWKALNLGIRRIADYIQLVEKEFLLPNHLGWESYLKKLRAINRIHEGMFLADRKYWAILILANIVGGIIFCLAL